MEARRLGAADTHTQENEFTPKTKNKKNKKNKKSLQSDFLRAGAGASQRSSSTTRFDLIHLGLI